MWLGSTPLREAYSEGTRHWEEESGLVWDRTAGLGWGLWREAEGGHPGCPVLVTQFQRDRAPSYLTRKLGRLAQDSANGHTSVTASQAGEQLEKRPATPLHPRPTGNTEGRYNHSVLLLIIKDVK